MANPNPSPKTRFKEGNTFGGKTSEQKRLEYEAAEMAAKARHRLLSVITEKMDAIDKAFTSEEIEDRLEALLFARGDFLKLFKDSEDRAHGTPTATIAGDPDRPIVHKVERALVRPKN